MTVSDFNPTILEEGLGAAAIATTILTSPITRPWYRKWGATETELTRRLPGDEQVPDPTLESTRAITIQTSAAEVWPWLVQMGQGRGGLYSYERLENLAGCGMRNADQIVPEYQDLQAGDKIRISQSDSTPYFVVNAIEPGRAIVLGGDDPLTTWSFNLEPIDQDTTRLIIRFRQQYEPSFSNIVGWRVFTDPIAFVMERKMLQGIKARVEAGDQE